MKKGLKIFALGVAALGIGCVALTGCGESTPSETDEFANAAEVTVADFESFQESVTSNELANYTIRYEYSGIVIDGQCKITEADDGTYSTDMAFTLTIPESVTGSTEMTAQYYLKDNYLYISSGETKIKYDYSEYLESTDMDFTTTIEGMASIDEMISTLLSEETQDYLTIKKITTENNETKFQLTISEYTDEDGTTGSMVAIVTYDENNNFTNLTYDMSYSYEYTVDETTRETGTYTITGSVELAKATTDITFPDDLNTAYELYTEETEESTDGEEGESNTTEESEYDYDYDYDYQEDEYVA